MVNGNVTDSGRNEYNERVYGSGELYPLTAREMLLYCDVLSMVWYYDEVV